VKKTDYAPRVAPFDAWLRHGRNLVGVEVGVDAGAHAHALLQHTDTAMLYLVDPWPREYIKGYCEGRLLGFWPRFSMVQHSSERAAQLLICVMLDYAYFDEERTANVTFANLRRWWPLLKPGGHLGYRGYAAGHEVKEGVDRFVEQMPGQLRVDIVHGEEIILVKL
jgi:hypothetical protein